MELSAVGERVFAAESIIKRRIRKVGEKRNTSFFNPELLVPLHRTYVEAVPRQREKVLVTDVTTNFLTVTIKESSTSKGFFKDKR
uniref:Uncharacterized protein n=1 Tax=Sphaeramia orbicularis TaxID=375764 RepID=A0A672YSA6_9TELE